MPRRKFFFEEKPPEPKKEWVWCEDREEYKPTHGYMPYHRLYHCTKEKHCKNYVPNRIIPSCIGGEYIEV